MSQDVHQQAKRGLVWIAGTTAVWQAVSWIFTFLTARVLRPSDYGLLAMSQAVFPYIGLVCNLRLTDWVAQREHLSEDEERSLFTLSLALGIVSTALAFAGATFIAWFYEEPLVELPFQVSSLVFFFMALRTIPEGKLRREMRFKELGLANLAVSLLQGVFQLLLAIYGWSYWALVFGGLLREVLLTSYLFSRARVPLRISLEKAHKVAALRFGSAATASTILWVVYSTADSVVVGKLFGKELLGFYSMAFFLADLPLSKINTVLSPLLVPYFSKLRSDPADLRRVFEKINAIVVSLISPVLVGGAVVAADLIPLALGDHWSGMVPAFQALCLAFIWKGAASSVSPLFLALNKPKALVRVSVLTILGMIPGFIILGWFFSPKLSGIYLTWLLIYPMAFVLPSLLMVKRELGLRMGEFFYNQAPAYFASLVMALVCLLAASFMDEATAPARLLVLIPLGALAYVATLMLAFRRSTRELFSVMASIRNRSGQ